MPSNPRTSFITRSTNETKIQISLSLDGGILPIDTTNPNNNVFSSTSKDGLTIPPTDAPHSTQFTPTQQIYVNTGIGFLDHMLHALAKHAGWSLGVLTKGDLYSKYIIIYSMNIFIHSYHTYKFIQRIHPSIHIIIHN